MLFNRPLTQALIRKRLNKIAASRKLSQPSDIFRALGRLLSHACPRSSLIQSADRQHGEPAETFTVGKYKVDNFGAVRMLGQRVALSAAQDLFYVGDTARLTVRRDGRIHNLEVKLRPSTHLVPRCLYCGKVTIEPLRVAMRLVFWSDMAFLGSPVT
eukprot:s825_g1.t2